MSAAKDDMVTLVGVAADGTEHELGQVTMPPKMKARELVRENFGPIDEEDGNDAAMAFWICEQLIEWMQAQGGVKVELSQPKPVDSGARALIEQCRDALAEELAAWDIKPPLHHVKSAHDACVTWLAGPAAAPQAEPSQCAQCKKPYRPGTKKAGCPKCAPGVTIAESEFRKPLTPTLSELMERLDGFPDELAICGEVKPAKKGAP